MGATKQDFMNDREEAFYQDEEQERGLNELDLYRSFNTISDAFVTKADEYENGNISALDTAIDFKKEIESLETQIGYRKTWIDENKDSIENEAVKYPEGYNGFKVSMQSRTTKSFKNIVEWMKLEQAKKDFEAKSNAAYAMVKKGGLNVDADGQEIPLPEISVSSFIKFDKVK